MTRGFLLGKFMPPHAGHMILCDTARRLVDRLTILVCWLPDDPVPGPLRLAWMEELFPDCRVVGHGAPVPQAPEDSPDFWPIWRSIVGQVHPEPIDRLFAGEDYGRRLAAEVGATFVPVGPRPDDGISGTAVRADPWGCWDSLPPPVRAHYARTICLHGPESTGKSTLAPRLARHFDTRFVPEYGRVHCQVHGYDLDSGDLLTIAGTQSAMIEASRRWCNRLLIADTDALMTAAWCRMLLGHVPEGLLDGFRPADLYLLMEPDVPWVDDGTRYFGGESRLRFMRACVEVLDRAGVEYVRVQGDWRRRFDSSIAAIEGLGWSGRQSRRAGSSFG